RISGRCRNTPNCCSSSTSASIPTSSVAKARPRTRSTRCPPIGRRRSRNTAAPSRRSSSAEEAFGLLRFYFMKQERGLGDHNDFYAGFHVAGGRPRLERHLDPQSLHHPDDPVPDRLQHLPADLFAWLFLHRFPRLD